MFNTLEDPKKGQLKIQFDYLAAYFDFFTSTDFLVARRICQQYDDYPVMEWRMMFLTMADQLAEFDGDFDNEQDMLNIEGQVLDADAAIRDARQKNLKDQKKKEAQMEATIDEFGCVHVDSANLREVNIKYYSINAELLFSRQPFLKDNTQEFTYVKAMHSLRKEVHPATATDEQITRPVKSQIPLPDQMKNGNMVLEITSGDL